MEFRLGGILRLHGDHHIFNVIARSLDSRRCQDARSHGAASLGMFVMLRGKTRQSQPLKRIRLPRWQATNFDRGETRLLTMLAPWQMVIFPPHERNPGSAGENGRFPSAFTLEDSPSSNGQD